MRLATGKNGFLKIATALLFAVTLTCGTLSNLVNANDGITSNAIIHRAGLTVEWFTHSGAGAGGNLSDWHININENKSTTFFSIEAGNHREKFSQHRLNAFGEPYGIDGAEEYAAVRVDVLKAELENDGIKDVEVKVNRYTSPQTTIYALTSNAIVKAIDGDTGETKWSTNVGDPRLPSIGVGSSNEMVAAVNGSTVYCLDAETGKQLWTAHCKFAPSSSPSVSEGKVYVPLINGRLETFVEREVETPEDEKEPEDAEAIKKKLSVAKETFIESHAFVAKGRGTSRPLITDVTVAWPTSKGEMNVAAKYGVRPGLAYQLRADKAIISAPVFKDGIFFVTSLDGFVYAVDQERGTVVWQFSTGQSISQSAITLGNDLFVINDNKQMYKFDAKTGWTAEGWDMPLSNIDRFVGASKNQMYVLDQFGSLKVISPQTGTTISTVRIEGVQSILPNLQSDRLYLASDRGMIQCIRELGSPIPHFHSNEFAAVEVNPARKVRKADDDQPAAEDGAVDLDDPFKSKSPADDPFKGGSKPADDDNPFGGGANTTPADDSNPFGGGASKPADDSNPFGGGSSKPAADDNDPFK